MKMIANENLYSLSWFQDDIYNWTVFTSLLNSWKDKPNIWYGLLGFPNTRLELISLAIQKVHPNFCVKKDGVMKVSPGPFKNNTSYRLPSMVYLQNEMRLLVFYFVFPCKTILKREATTYRSNEAVNLTQPVTLEHIAFGKK